MKSDPDKLLNQLVVAALTVFIAVTILLAALVLRQVWLQQRVVDLSSDVQVNLEDLEELTEEIQRELAERRATPDQAENVDEWEEVREALGEVDERLNFIEEDLDEVTQALGAQTGTPAVSAGNDVSERAATQDQVDQVFTIFAVLVGVAGIVVAILLGMALRVQQGLRDDVNVLE